MFRRLLLICLCLHFLCFPSVSGLSVSSLQYTPLPSVDYCVRLLHKGGAIGCSSARDGDLGTLYLTQSQAHFDSLLSTAPSDSLAIVLPYSLLTRANLFRLRSSSLSIAGILVLQATAAPVPPFNPECSAPQFIPPPSFFGLPSDLSASSLASPYYSLSPRFNSSYPWNSVGDCLIREDFPFSIVYLSSPAENSKVFTAAQQNEIARANGKFASQAAQFKYYMYAKKNSVECLKDRTCIPVGGFSVWGSLFAPPKLNGSFVMATAARDSSALFHTAAPGADADQSGTVALLAAARALGRFPAARYLPKQILFSLFNGESWGSVGSRKFVWDLQNFRCSKYQFDDNGLPVGCSVPYMYDLTFQRINFSSIEAIIELNQVGKNTTLWMHREKDQIGSAASTQLQQSIVTAAGSLVGQPISVLDADASTPGLPPSSSAAFLAANSQLPAVLLADHDKQFSNLYYHSMFDDGSNVLLDSSLKPAQLCQVASLTARSLFLSAGGSAADADSLNADCNYVNSMFNCLAVDLNCPEIARVSTIDWPQGKLPTHYAGVFMHRLPKYMTGLTRFLQYQLNQALTNGSNTAEPLAFWHDAVDPALQFDWSSDSGGWTAQFTRNDTFVWTESNWDDSIGVKLFRFEDPKVDAEVLAAGIVYFVLNAAAVYWGSRIMRKRFKL